MTFGEKLREYRRKKGLTQKELAALSGISPNTIINYEGGKSYPQNREVYARLAELLGVSTATLCNENEDFVTMAGDKYGYRGQSEAEALVAGFTGLMAGGELSQADKDAVMRALQDIYWGCKEENIAKYKNKK